MLSVIKESTVVLSKGWRDVIGGKRGHRATVVLSERCHGGGMLSVINGSTMVLSKRWREVISDKRKRITLGCRCRSFNLSQAATTFE